MAVNKRLLQGAAAAGGLVPSEHFGVVLYEGNGAASHSINGGKFGAAAYFAGSGNITPSGLTSDQLGPNGEMSISWWMNTPINDTTVAFICEGDTDSVYMVHLGGSYTRGMKVSFVSGQGTNELDINNAFTANTWQHFVAVMTPTGNKLYRDGSLIGSNTFSFTRDSFSTFYIGSRRNSSLRFEGKLDQLRIFAKELSSSEVSTLYAETAATVESLDPLSEDTTDTLQVLGDSSCIATYRFENDETDLSGNYDGTGTEIQYAAGRYGQAASFNGSSSYINPNGDWGVNGDSSHSVSFWVNFNSSSGTQHFYGIGDTVTAFTHTSLYIDSSLGTVVHDNNGNSDNLATSLGLSTGQWYHFVLVYDTAPADAIITLYINSESKGTATRTLNVTGDAVIGRRPYYASNYLNADLDQFRVFNKAISASEVTTLYNENSLVASYRFEGNANDDTRNYDGSASNVSYEYGLGFTPDFVWIKERTKVENHRWFDTTRGATKFLGSNNANAEATGAATLTSFDTGGFTLGLDNEVNDTGIPYVAWCLKANEGTTSSNTDGTITSTVQANDAAGFSIVQYNGNGSGGATIGHGLSLAPELTIIKKTSGTENWYYQSEVQLGNWDKNLRLDTTDALQTSSTFVTGVSSSVTTLGTSTAVNGSGTTYINYNFYSVEGFSKFGSYTGNGSTTGPIVETGFEPAFLMVKGSSNSGGWLMFDNKRNTTNPRTKILYADSSTSETTNSNIKVDFLSNGFQLVGTDSDYNGSGRTYIYMAFAADPDTEAPTVAKSFSTVAYTGNGSSNRTIEGLGFSPSLLWLKSRTTTEQHYLFDTIRGHSKYLHSNLTDAQGTDATTRLKEFLDDGFKLGNELSVNQNNEDFVAWAWKADDNEPTINTEGTIDTLVSANANAGFSIVNWTGGSSGTATTGHGLSASPELIIQRPVNATSDWFIWHKDLTSGNSLRFTTAAESTAIAFTVNSSVFYTNWTNTSYNWIAYCFHSVAGYSKIGSYTGTGTTNSITGLGFQPDWVLIKETTAAESWRVFDSVRGATERLFPDNNGAESTASDSLTAFDSDGFSLGSSAGVNQSGQTYIYMAFKIN